MNDLENFLLGNDWIYTITVPNKIVKKYPLSVSKLQRSVDFIVKGFNANIKENVRAEATSQNLLDQELDLEPINFDEHEKSVLTKIKADKKKEEDGKA
jgi:hypothetical protein